MKSNNNLTSILYIISRLSFRLCQLILLFAVIFELIPDGKLGGFHATSHHSKGYPLNAKVQINVPDTIITYKRGLANGSVQKSGNKEFDETFNRVKNDNSVKKTFFITNFTIYGNEFEEIPKQNINPKIDYQGSEIKVTLNPKNYFFKFILMLKSYLSLILLAFISYQFMRLFKQLKTNFSFNDLLNKRIKYIGFALLSYQAINFIASFIAMQYFSTINYYHYTPSIVNSRFNFINLSTETEYSLSMIFLGLCCLVLAKLLNYGYALQNENDLTI